MVFPGSLVTCALLTALHNKNEGAALLNHSQPEPPPKKSVSRRNFYLIATAGSFVWFWFPGYIFTALSMFNWVCWIAPNNVVVNQLFGTSSGLGMGILTFDWSMIDYVNSPMVMPVSQLHQFRS